MTPRPTLIVCLLAAGCVAIPAADLGSSRLDLSSVASGLTAVESSTGTVTEVFGAAVDARGITVAVGAPELSGGRVVLFRDRGDVAGFAEQAVIDAPSPLPFGVEVAVGNHDVVVTSSDGATSEVWASTNDPDTGAFSAPVQIVADSPVGPRFGQNIAIHTRFLVVTDPSPDGITPGRALIFARTDAGWVQEAKLSEAGNPFYGTTVAIWDDCAIVSSGSAAASGQVFAYVRNDEGVWNLDGTLFAPGTVPGDGFGASIVANDKDIFVGAPGSDLHGVDSGAIFFYVHRGDGWEVNRTFGLEAAAGGERLGTSLAMDRDFLLTGAPGSDISANNSGAAYLFWHYQNDGAHGVVDRLTTPTPIAGAGLGAQVALGDGLVIFSNTALPEVWQARYIRPPISVADAFVVPATAPYESEGSVLDNDDELDGEPMTAHLDSGTENGALELRSDGTFSYTPDPTFFGADTFTYIANDGTFDSRIAQVTLTVQALPAALCGEVLCPEDHLCYASACFPQCDDNASCGAGRSCFVGRCATDACTNVVCEGGQLCYGGSCFDRCSNGECAGSTTCFDGRCAADPCSTVQCPLEFLCHGGSCFRGCSEDSECGDSMCWDGRCTSDPCDRVQCSEAEVCVGGTCFLGCGSDDECGVAKQCIEGRCAANACDGISCRIGDICHLGSCVKSCNASSECTAGEACQGGKCLPAVEEQSGGCSTSGGDAPPWVLIVMLTIGLRRRR